MGTVGAICCCEKQWKGKQKSKHLHKVAKMAANIRKKRRRCVYYVLIIKTVREVGNVQWSVMKIVSVHSDTCA